MSNWTDKPPTYKEWLDAGNHGMWWIKFMLSPEYSEKIMANALTDEEDEIITWPEVWITEIVMVSVSYTNRAKHILQEIKGEEPDYSGIELHATSALGIKLRLDDSEATKNMYWQAVAPPLDDVKDQRPK